MHSNTESDLEAASVASVCGVVVIGRNEGERLRRCIQSVQSHASTIVYVDSGSTDGSVELARSRGVDTVELDMRIPFTAARARNAGAARLAALIPDLPFIQFVDGDCEVLPGWLDVARDFLETHADVAGLCGLLRERHPETSVYNLLCDLEWQAPSGESRSTGGNAMFRSVALKGVGGFREDLIGGEEPELCVRLRKAGWKIWRLDEEMALHDAAMTKFRQWWNRTKRGGFGAAQGMALHGEPPECHGVRETFRALQWGLLLPLVALGLASTHPAWLLLLLAYPLQAFRLALRDNIAIPARRWRALFMVLARFPEAQGVLEFWMGRLRRKTPPLIEYK